MSRRLSNLGLTALLARSFDEARRTLSRVQVDLICLDSILPEGEAEGFWRWLRAFSSRATPRLVLLATAAAAAVPSTLPPFFRTREHGLVRKPLDGEELACEVTRLLATRPRTARANETVRFGSLVLDAATRRLLFADGGSVALTPIECRLAGALMARAGDLVPTDELVEEVWGYPKGSGGPELVRAHVSNLRRKLRGAGEDPQLLRTVPFQGYGFVSVDADRR